MVKIIGISGTNGSGKDTVAVMLADRHNYLFVSATDMFVEELRARGLPIDRTHKSALSAEWRRQYGMAVVVDKAVDIFNNQSKKYDGLVIASLRHPAEAERIHEHGGTVVWVDADPKTRYERIQANLHERTTTHHEHDKTFEEFQAEEEREMRPVGDAATLNMAGVRELADITLLNNGKDKEAFKTEAEKTLGL